MSLQPSNEPTRTENSVASKITGGVSHLGDLRDRSLGKIIIVLDQSSKTLQLIGDLKPQFLRYFTPSWDTQFGILDAVANTSRYLGVSEIQQHADIVYPKGIRGPILGGAAAYYDGNGSLYINAASVDFGNITEGALRLCLQGSDKKLFIGEDILPISALWRPSIESEVARALKG